MKVIIGIGDSWTQGVGGVPDIFFKKWGGRVDINEPEDEILYKYELENSWVNVLKKKYFTDYTVFNCGMRGYGNRGSVKNLFYYNLPLDDITEGYLIFMLSGRERFDIVKNEKSRRIFYTLYPHDTTPNYKWFLKNIYTNFGANQETLLNIIEAQTFAKAYNLDFYFANSFDDCTDIKDDEYGLSKHIDWNKLINPNTNFFNLLCEYEGVKPDYGWLFKQKYPLKYITNCIHPTIIGYEIIADYIYKKIMNNK